MTELDGQAGRYNPRVVSIYGPAVYPKYHRPFRREDIHISREVMMDGVQMRERRELTLMKRECCGKHA
jgi:hypothetical protein